MNSLVPHQTRSTDHGRAITRSERRGQSLALRSIELAEQQAEAAVNAVYDLGDHAIQRGALSYMMAKSIIEGDPEMVNFIAPAFETAVTSARMVQLRFARSLL